MFTKLILEPVRQEGHGQDQIYEVQSGRTDIKTGTGIRAPSAGPVGMHVWAVDGGRCARPSAADVVPSDSTVAAHVKV